MCFAPHRRALFQHLNFQKRSESDVFCAFWLREVLRAATTCTFSTAQRPEVVWSWGASDIWLQTVLPAIVPSTFPTSPLPKVAQSCGLLNIFTSKSACGIRPSGSAPAALASLLFDRPGPQNIGKTVFCDFSTFSRACMFFLLTLSLLWSSFFFLSLLWLFPPLLFYLSILSEVWLLVKVPSVSIPNPPKPDVVWTFFLWPATQKNTSDQVTSCRGLAVRALACKSRSAWHAMRYPLVI